MKIKHKLLSDYQYTSSDKKIFLIKSGTILDNYNYRIKDEMIEVDKDIIDNNPQYFKIIDWKEELHTFIKVNKLPSPKTLANKLRNYIL